MIKTSSYQVRLCMVLVLTCGLLVRTGWAAGGGGEDKVLRLYATASAGPIGQVLPVGEIEINGRAFSGEEFLWGGEMLRAGTRGAHVSLESIGEVTLAGHSLVRLTSARGASDTDASRFFLIASLVSGNMSIRLKQDAGAYIEAGGETFSASPGASFRLKVRDGEAVLETEEGSVAQDAPAQQRNYVIRPIGLGSTLSVRARATRQIQFQVTDEHDRRVPDAVVIISLGGKGGGTLSAGSVTASSVTVTTNAQGVATASFTAGDVPGADSITANVQGTNATWTGTVSIGSAAGGLSGTTIAIIAAAAGAGVTTAVVATRSGNNNNSVEDIQALPPDITPKP